MKKYILFTLLIITSQNLAFWTSLWEILGTNLFYSLNTKPLTKKIVIKNFCSIIDATRDQIYFYTTYQFDPKKSIFLKLLCNTTGIYNEENFAKNIKINSYLKKYLNLQNNSDNILNKNTASIKKDCYTPWINTLEWSLNNLDLACVARKIFNLLANDITNIAILKAYWNFSNQEELNTRQENNFWTWICKDWNFLNATNNSKNSLCNHPLTYNYLNNLSKKWKIILSNLNTIYIEDWIDKFLEKLGYTDNNISSMIKLKNLLYNELYFYQLFLSYYKVFLKNMPSWWTTVKVWSTIDATIFNSLNKEISKINFYQQISLNSLNTTFQIIAQIKATFPIHIGFLALLEDINSFRHALAKIYTPLDQLRYKLKNVQDLDKK